MSEQKMREEFEDWCLKNLVNYASGDDSMMDRMRWLVWQAACASKQREIDALKASFAEVQHNQAQLIRDGQQRIIELAAQVEVMHSKSDVLLRKINENVPVAEIELAESELRDALTITPSEALAKHDAEVAAKALQGVIDSFALDDDSSAECVLNEIRSDIDLIRGVK